MKQMATKKDEAVKPEVVDAKAVAIPDATGDLVEMTNEMFTAWINGDDIEEEDGDDFDVYALARQILGAESEAEALKQDDVRKPADMHDERFTILSVVWRKSVKSDSGKGRYAVLRCVDGDGTPFLMTCGAVKVVLQVRKAQLEGWLPWTVVLNAETTASNRTVLELVAPGDF